VNRRIEWGRILVALALALGPWSRPADAAKEFLTPAEILKIQDAPEIDKRIKIYLEAAALRLKTAEERLGGKESGAGDPLEFFTVEEMVEGYYRILRSVMFTLDDAVERPKDPDALAKALKNLKDRTEKDAKSLEILHKIAEEKKKEELWNLVNQATEIASGAHDGAEGGLTRFKEREKGRGKGRSKPD